MINKITYTQKNKLLAPAIVVLAILCWLLVFDKTFEVIRIYYQSSYNSQQENSVHDLSFDPNYSERKLRALDKILGSYNVNKAKWSNDVWLTVSSLAASKKIAIDFTAIRPSTEVDSISVGVKQRFLFYGDYINLIKLLDTLEHTSKIGRISGVQIKVQNKDIQTGPVDKCKLEVSLQGL